MTYDDNFTRVLTQTCETYYNYCLNYWDKVGALFDFLIHTYLKLVLWKDNIYSIISNLEVPDYNPQGAYYCESGTLKD